MHAMQGHAQTVADTTRMMISRGQSPALIWLPEASTPGTFAAYLCARTVSDGVQTYRVVSSLGLTVEGEGYSKTGVSWAAMDAGAAFVRMGAEAAPRSNRRVVMPCGAHVYR